MSLEDVTWYRDPLLYARTGGFGMVVGAYHYRFRADGTLESIGQLTRPVLRLVLDSLFPGQADALLAVGITSPVKAIGKPTDNPAPAEKVESEADKRGVEQ